MQLLPPLTRDPKVMAREAPSGTHLPYARHVDRRTIETRDGLLLQVVRLGGLLFETADSDELNYRAELRDAMLRALGSSRFAVYHHLLRRTADVALKPDESEGFSGELDRRWRERFEAKRLYVNELYLTIVRRPLQGRVGLADRAREWLGRSTRRNAERLAADRHALDNAVDALVAALGPYDPQVLATVETPQGTRSEPLEFLGSLFNLAPRPVNLPAGDLGHHLPARRISFAGRRSNTPPPDHCRAPLPRWSRSRTGRAGPCRECSTN